MYMFFLNCAVEIIPITPILLLKFIIVQVFNLPQPLFDKRGDIIILLKNIEPEAINSKHNCVRYLSQLTFVSKRNRNNPTEAEQKMWNNFLSKNKTGFRFLRQKPIHRFIIDFYCSKLNLAIEIDGESHIKKKEYDVERDKFLKQIGIKTIRFTNEEVINKPEYVKSVLLPLVKGGRGD
jgi:very-short-patch-repair endonuclease